MKIILEINKTKVPIVRIFKSINKYDDMIGLPEKIKKARQAYDNLGLPDLKKYCS